MEKSADAYRTISEVAEELKLPQHVLRFWETRFPQIKPMKRGGNRRFYRPEDVDLLRAIKALLYSDGFTIKGVQRILKEQGPRAVANLAQSGQLRPSAKRQTRSEEEQGQDEANAPGEPDPVRPVGELVPAAPRRLGQLVSRADSNGAGAPRGAVAVSGLAPESLFRRLEEVLFQLSECERILASARL